MRLKKRRLIALLLALGAVVVWLIVNPASYESEFTQAVNDGADYAAEAVSAPDENAPLARDILEKLEVKGRAPKTDYSREQFYSGWPNVDGCSLRQRIIRREFGESAVLNECNVMAGEYDEPYTGEHMVFTEREQISKGIQIDHVVALSDAWQKGAQNISAEKRYELATDPLNLLAVDGDANKKKSDGDAATWLPLNKKFRCQYVARQVSVKYKYSLWVTEAEKNAISKVLENCPKEPAVGV
ncbi:HNH endonuclease [Candidatus Saccharibacteria bacterium]|nr:HNH endonuclease [Candidatus Saccharibacteria bacterium]